MSLFIDSGNLDTRKVRGLCRVYLQLKNLVGRTRWKLQGEWVKWNLVSVYLETMLALMQYRCMVCAKRTIGSEIVSDAPDDAPW
jgi:hypothetical protein